MKTTMKQPATVQNGDEGLRDPEFYEVGDVAEVTCDYGRTVHVRREGESRLESTETDDALITATDFRNAWGMSGIIPDADQGWEWVNNGWFTLYTACGRQIFEDVTYDLPEAIEQAQDWLIESGKRLLTTATSVQAAA